MRVAGVTWWCWWNWEIGEEKNGMFRKIRACYLKLVQNYLQDTKLV